MAPTSYRPARFLAVVIASCCATAALVAFRSLIRRLEQPTLTSDTLWSTAVIGAATLACCWAAIVAIAAFREIGRPEPRSGGAARLLATVLISLTCWGSATSGSALAAPDDGSGVAVTLAVPDPRTTVPSPDFSSDPVAPHRDSPITEPCRDAFPQPSWAPTTPKAIAPADRSRLLMPCDRPTDDLSVVVRRGDSLWTIVGRSLGPQAAAIDIARAVPMWHAANRAVIGADPDLLFAGQILHPPTDSTDAQGVTP